MKNLLKPTLLSLFCILLLFTFNSQAQYAKSAHLKSFHSVHIRSGLDLQLIPSDREEVTIKSNNEEHLRLIEITENDGNLSIGIENNRNFFNSFRNVRATVYLKYKRVNAITASGGADVKSDKILESEALTLHSSGGADIDLNIKVKDLSVKASGGADITLRGSSANVQMTGSGGADINAFGLSTNNAEAKASGGASIEITVNQNLRATASGGGDIHYKGNPSVTRSNNSKSGTVKKVSN